MNPFDQKLKEHQRRLERSALETLQINVGRKCNQACRHCHVDAAPWRSEMMDATTAHRIFEWIERYPPKVVDITGGAPELSEFFQPLVKVSRGAGCRVIDRNNLTILEEPGFETLHEFLAEYEVEIIASLPCYEPKNVHKQRGQGVFDKSIRGLLKLNSVGYGCGKLPLHLVYNPLGASLPGPQAALEEDYRKALKESHGVHFDRLLTLTNQPIARFAEDLRAKGQWEAYMELLAQAFNPDTLEGLMCRSTLNVGYQGELFDCDFNQMLGLHMAGKKPIYLWEADPEHWSRLPITTGAHCLACSAGAGSSCTGALTG